MCGGSTREAIDVAMHGPDGRDASSENRNATPSLLAMEMIRIRMGIQISDDLYYLSKFN